MATYLCGYSMVMSSYSVLIKGQSEQSLDFHTDTLLPPPWPEHALVCNGTYLLTDFDPEKGSTVFMPGSHKLRRGPTAEERSVTRDPSAVSIEA